MMATCWLLPLVTGLIVLLDPAESARVIDRFTKFRDPEAKCRIGHQITPGSESMMGLFSSQMRILSDMNCTMVVVDIIKTGKMDSNGSFDGMLGQIQRNEVDYIAYFWRLDYLEQAPGIIVPLTMPADAVIVMKKQPSGKIFRGLVDGWAGNFDLITVTFVLISIFFFIVVLSFATEPCVSMKQMVKCMSENLRRSIFAIFDQENFESANWPSRIAVLFFNLFLLFGIHGIMLGVLGADMVTDVDHPIYESLDEFSSTSVVQPTIIGNLWLLQLLEKTGPGSELWPLKQAIVSHSDQNIFRVNMNPKPHEIRAMAKISSEVEDGRRAMIVPRTFIERGMIIGCILIPELGKKCAYSKRSFGNGVMVSVISRSANKLFQSVLQYSIMTDGETGIMTGTMRMLIETHPSLEKKYGDTQWQEEYHKCLLGPVHESHDPTAFAMDLYDPVFRQLGFASAAATMILVIEICCMSVTEKWLSNRKIQPLNIRNKKENRREVRCKSASDRLVMVLNVSDRPRPHTSHIRSQHPVTPVVT